MKKLLGILVLGLLWSNIGFSQIIELNQCYFQGKDTSWKLSGWKKWSESSKAIINQVSGDLEYTKEKFQEKEDYILSIDINRQMIFVTEKFTDFYIEDGRTISNWYDTEAGKKQKEEILKDNTDDVGISFWKTYLRTLTNRQKYDLEEYSLLTYAGGIVIGQLINDNLIVEEKIYIDLEKGTFITGWKLDGSNLPQMGGYICNLENTSSGENTKGSSGTAFFITNKGHLLTNNHVVDGCEVSKINYKGKDYDTQLLATDKTLDLALLKADLRNKSYLNFSSDEAKKMQKIYVGGYPLGKGLSDDLKISSGIVSSLKGFEDNSNEIQIDAAINPGNSGGPIINGDGELVAIAVSGMSKDKTEGINFGIKVSAAERFLNEKKSNV
jgi:S1-C subfamily serine protease